MCKVTYWLPKNDITEHTPDLTLGKPGIVDEHIAIREYLCITTSLDHDMIEGVRSTRFTRRLKELIESGYGLCEGEATYATDSHT